MTFNAEFPQPKTDKHNRTSDKAKQERMAETRYLKKIEEVFTVMEKNLKKLRPDFDKC